MIENFSTTKQEIIKDAIKSGYTAEYQSGRVALVKRTAKKKQIKHIGLLLYEDGTAHPVWHNAELSLIRCTRSHKRMREILNI